MFFAIFVWNHGLLLKQGIGFVNFCLKQGIFSWTINSLRICSTNVLNRVEKTAIFVLNRVRVWGPEPHLPTQGYIEYPPGNSSHLTYLGHDFRCRWLSMTFILQFHGAFLLHWKHDNSVAYSGIESVNIHIQTTSLNSLDMEPSILDKKIDSILSAPRQSAIPVKAPSPPPFV